MKYLRLALLSILLAVALLVPLNPAPASAAPTITTSTVADFPLKLTFKLNVNASQPLDDVRLHYKVARRSFVDVVSEVKLNAAGAQIETEYALDMRRIGGYPPGTAVDYWWTLADPSGAEVRSDPQRIVIEDSRYDWNQLVEGPVTVYWYRGDQAFGETILNAAAAAVQRLTQDAMIELRDPIEVYVYGDYTDLRSAMVFANEWTGGRAYPSYDAVVIGIAPDNIDWGLLAVSHEIGHLVTGQITENPFLGLPVWLNEGLAVSAQPAVQTDFLQALNSAKKSGTLISIRSLTSPFSADSATVSLSYAQGWSVVQFLVQEYGQDKMNQLLQRFSEGIGYDALLEEIYGFDMDGLDQRWRQAVDAGTAPGFGVKVS